jgi:anti-sigma B factor antagonist
MPTPLVINNLPLPDGTLLQPTGEIDLARSPELRQRLREELERRPKRLIIDLSKVAYMDSSGVATLVEALQRSKAANCRLILTGLQPKVKSIFAIARLDSVFAIAADIEAARTA